MRIDSIKGLEKQTGTWSWQSKIGKLSIMHTDNSGTTIRILEKNLPWKLPKLPTIAEGFENQLKNKRKNDLLYESKVKPMHFI